MAWVWQGRTSAGEQGRLLLKRQLFSDWYPWKSVCFLPVWILRCSWSSLLPTLFLTFPLFSPVCESTFAAIPTWWLPCVASAMECWLFALGWLRAKSRSKHVGVKPSAHLGEPLQFRPRSKLEDVLKLKKAMEWPPVGAGTVSSPLSYWRILVCCSQHFWFSDQQPGPRDSWLSASLATTWATWKLLISDFHDPRSLRLPVKFCKLLWGLRQVKEKKPIQTQEFPHCGIYCFLPWTGLWFQSGEFLGIGEFSFFFSPLNISSVVLSLPIASNGFLDWSASVSSC